MRKGNNEKQDGTVKKTHKLEYLFTRLPLIIMVTKMK